MVGLQRHPGFRISALAPASDDAQPVALPGPDEEVSFANSMRFAFDLWSYDDVVAHARAILAQVRAGSMPCDGVWPAEQVEVFARWTDGGTPP